MQKTIVDEKLYNYELKPPTSPSFNSNKLTKLTAEIIKEEDEEEEKYDQNDNFVKESKHINIKTKQHQQKKEEVEEEEREENDDIGITFYDTPSLPIYNYQTFLLVEGSKNSLEKSNNSSILPKINTTSSSAAKTLQNNKIKKENVIKKNHHQFYLPFLPVNVQNNTYYNNVNTNRQLNPVRQLNFNNNNDLPIDFTTIINDKLELMAKSESPLFQNNNNNNNQNKKKSSTSLRLFHLNNQIKNNNNTFLNNRKERLLKEKVNFIKMFLLFFFIKFIVIFLKV
jgi:hypothetical protein